MLTGVERVIIHVADLDRGVETFRNLGFDVQMHGDTAQACTPSDCLELRPGDVEGLATIVVASNDFSTDIAAMRARGIDVDDQGSVAGVPLQFRQREARPPAGTHPNGILRIDRTYVCVPDLAPTCELYARILGTPVPPVERGLVIKSDMAIFSIGSTGIGVATPVADGPAAEALRRRGRGPFQVLYRTAGMGAAVRWMVEHGLPEPARAVRNTGEQAILVSPDHACGTYIALVGPE